MEWIPNAFPLGKQGGPGFQIDKMVLSTFVVPISAITASISPGACNTYGNIKVKLGGNIRY